MSSTPVNWRLLPAQTIVNPSSVGEYLDAIETSLGSSVYADGSARSVFNWSASRETNAVVCIPFLDGLTQRVIFAGAASGSPTMAAPDSFVANEVLIGQQKNAGAWSAWDAVSPMTSGEFSGYWRTGFGGLPAATITLQIAETLESLVVNVWYDTSFEVYRAWGGALWRVEASDAEADGRRYGMMVGGIGGQNSNWLGNSSSTKGGLYHSAVDGNGHAGVMVVGGSGIETLGRTEAAIISTTADTNQSYLKTPSSKFIGHGSVGHSRQSDGSFIGSLRGVRYGPYATQSQIYSDGGTDLGIALAYSANVADQSLILVK